LTRTYFAQIVADVVDSLPNQFRERIHNLVVLVEDRPKLRRKRPHVSPGKAAPSKRCTLLLGVFQGVPATQRSVFDFSVEPNRIILYQKNIEAVCSSDAEIRQEIRQTVLHELGHYFGLNEEELKDV